MPPSFPVAGPAREPALPIMKGEPYGQLKRRAHHLLNGAEFDDEETWPYCALRSTIERLIDTAPQQTLEALSYIAEARGV